MQRTHHLRAPVRFAAVLVCSAAVLGCGSEADSAIDILCADSAQSLVAVAQDLEQLDGETGIEAFGPRLNQVDAWVGELEVSGATAAARDEVVAAVDDMQAAAQELRLEPRHVSRAGTALRTLDAELCR
jgi:hypothetical protein